MATHSSHWGFDTKELDPTIRPQDDFFHHVNKKWMKANPIPPEESRWGSFVELRYKTDKQLHAILSELEAKRATKGSPEQMIRDFYRSGMDMRRRNALGLKPIQSLIDSVKDIETKDDVIRVVAAFHRIGASALWGAFIDQDSKKSDRYLLHLCQDGLGLPDRDYYLKEDAESRRVRNAYLKHAERLYVLMGRSPADAKRETKVVYAIEHALAEASMKKEDTRDSDKTYHRLSPTELVRKAPGIDWKWYLEEIGAHNAKSLIVMQPHFLSAVSKLLDSVPLSDWKTYLEFHVVGDFASALTEKFVQEQFSFYGTVLSGTKTMKPLWRRILGTVNGNLGELLGQIYVKKHFSKESKKKMNILVDDLLAAYALRIKQLDWMSTATKRKALQKLRAMNRKIGYPDKWRSYRGLIIKQDDYVGNLIRTSKFEHRRQMKKLTGPIDRNEWFMYPQTVNAYFAPNMNDIVFPAAILQAPYFSLDADDAINYGAIGTVIGHEITHGFDDNGSKFDAKGNLRNWWTPGDKKRFLAKSLRVRKQFDKYVVPSGLSVKGELTLGENIADLGGLSIALDAYHLRLKKTGRHDIDGLSPEQRFFIGFAVFERENVRPEFEKMQVLNDPHAPGIFRINGPASNMQSFYDAYGVKNGDKLYRTPADREVVW